MTSPILTLLSPSDWVAAGNAATLEGDIVDLNGNAVGQGVVQTFTLTLIDYETGQIVNGVNGTDILNTGRGQLDVLGHFVITLSGADTGIFTSGENYERRKMVLNWTYPTNLTGTQIVYFAIVI